MKLAFFVAIFMSIGWTKTMTFSCHYEKYFDGKKMRTTEFDLTFLIDSETGKAYLIGNNGSAEVTVYLTDASDGFAFLEVTPAQNLMTTSIDKGLKSVHSRHTNIAGELVPSQYYGSCSTK